jgi:hypothetical protein
MATLTEYEADAELSDMVTLQLDTPELKELQSLRDNEVAILSCVRIRMKDDEDVPCKGKPAKIKKLGDVERLFVDNHAHYVLVMDRHFWKHANKRQQMANVFDALMDIQAEMTESGLKLKKRPSDVDFSHMATINYFGPYNENTLNLFEAYSNTSYRLKEFVEGIKLMVPTLSDEDESKLVDEMTKKLKVNKLPTKPVSR